MTDCRQTNRANQANKGHEKSTCHVSIRIENISIFVSIKY